MYVSEFTVFIEALKAHHPALAIDQKKGRAMWWDKAPVTPSEQEQLRQSHVSQLGYVYSIKG